MKKQIITWLCAAVLGTSLAGALAATGASPLGTWDFFLNGSQGQGLARLSFYDDFTFDGSELLTVKSHNGTAEIGRGSYDNYGRDSGIDSVTNAVLSTTNLFGFGEVNGPWTYDSRGKVIGYFVERVAIEDSTNFVLNSVSFTAKVSSGKKMTLVASTPNGKVVYTGVRAQDEMPDMSGAWYATKKKGKQSFMEMYELAPLVPPYLYSVVGTGAGYSFEGVAMVSAQKRMGLTSAILPDNSTNAFMRSVVGTLDLKRARLRATGAEEPSDAVIFDATRYRLP